MIAKKFKIDSEGNYYNDRMKAETDRRSSFCKSRRDSADKRWDKKDKPLSGKRLDDMRTHIHTDMRMETETDTENKDVTEKRKSFIIPTIDEVKVYFKENEYPETLAEKFFRGYDAAGWKDSEGKPVRSWKQKAQHVWFKPEEKKTSKVYDREARLKEMESWHEQKSV